MAQGYINPFIISLQKLQSFAKHAVLKCTRNFEIAKTTLREPTALSGIKFLLNIKNTFQ